MALNLSSLMRPNTVSIFAADPISANRILAFVLTNSLVPDPQRVRLDLTHSVTASSRATPARSPIVKAVADNIKLEPRTVSVTGTLSANPLGGILTVLGSFGTVVRRDLRQLKRLRTLQQTREPVMLVTPAEIFPSMSFSIDETHEGLSKVDLSLTFEEMRIALPITVSGLLDLDTLLAGAAGSTDLGATAGAASTTPTGLANFGPLG